MSARADETADPVAADPSTPRASARPPFQPRPKAQNCPACLGRGKPIAYHYRDEKGRTVGVLAEDDCEACGGCGHVGGRQYVRKSGADRTLSPGSLGKLGGMDVTRWPISRRRTEEP